MVKIWALFLSLSSACAFTGPAITEAATDAGALAGDASDAGAGGDAAELDAQAPGTDAPHAVTLSDTTPDVATEAGAGCVNGTSGAIYDGQWYRVFALSDPHWGVAGALSVTGVGFSIWKAQGTAGVKVEIGIYNGIYPTATLQPSMFDAMTQVTPTIANAAAGSGAFAHVTFGSPLAMPAGANLAVKISAGNGLQIGATANGVYQGGFFGSSMCAYSPPITSSGFIVTVDAMD